MNPIKTHRDGAILQVTLDRPKANAIDLATSRVMGEVFRDFRDDPDLRVAILTGGGEKFAFINQPNAAEANYYMFWKAVRLLLAEDAGAGDTKLYIEEVQSPHQHIHADAVSTPRQTGHKTLIHIMH